MAKAGTVTEIIDPKAQQQIDNAVESLVKMAKIIVEMPKASPLGGSTGGGKQQTPQDYDAVSAAAKRYEKQLQDLVAAQKDEIKALEERNRKIKEQVEADKLAEQIRKAAKGSLEETRLLIKQLTREYDALGKAQRDSAKGQDMAKQINELNTAYRNQKVALADMKANVGNYAESLKGLKTRMMESKETMGAMGNTVVNTTNIFNSFSSSTSVFSKSISMVTGGLSQLGGLLMAGGIGIALGAIAAAIWAISKAADIWVKRNDDLYESNIKLMRQLAGYRDSLNDFYQKNRQVINGLTDQEMKYSAVALEEGKRSDEALKSYQATLKKINNDPTYINEEDRLKKVSAASKQYADDIAKIENFAVGERNKLAQEGLKVTEARVKAIEKETAAIKNLGQAWLKAYQDTGGFGIGVGQTSSAAEIDYMKGGKLATGIDTGMKIQAPTKVENLTPEQQFQKEMEVWNNRLSTASEFYNQLTQLAANYYENQFSMLEEQQAADQQAKESELEAAGNNKRKIDEIEQRYAKKEKDRQKEAAKLRHDQAVYNKATSSVNAAINTAVAVTGALAALPGPAGIALAVIEAALGAIEIATILSQSIPAYAKGGEVKDTGIAKVSEKGQEGLIKKDGSFYALPKNESLVSLEKGDYVVTAEKFQEAVTSTTVPKYGNQSRTDRQYQTIQVNPNPVNLAVNFNERGFLQISKNDRDYWTYINKKVRFNG